MKLRVSIHPFTLWCPLFAPRVFSEVVVFVVGRSVVFVLSINCERENNARRSKYGWLADGNGDEPVFYLAPRRPPLKLAKLKREQQISTYMCGVISL